MALIQAKLMARHTAADRHHNSQHELPTPLRELPTPLHELPIPLREVPPTPTYEVQQHHQSPPTIHPLIIISSSPLPQTESAPQTGAESSEQTRKEPIEMRVRTPEPSTPPGQAHHVGCLHPRGKKRRHWELESPPPSSQIPAPHFGEAPTRSKKHPFWK